MISVPDRTHRKLGAASTIVCLFGLGCGSPSPSAAPAPIPDPGGPFQTGVPANTTLDALTNDQSRELCSEVSAGEQAYGLDGIIREETCRSTGVEAAGLSAATRDAGADGPWLSACQAAYDDCETIHRTPPPCELPTRCGATVELLSACLNEIANSDPIAACVASPTCAMAAAGPTTTSFGRCPIGGSGPSLPACVRLGQECPTTLGLIPYSDFSR